MPNEMRPLLIRDWRRPGQSMEALPLKLPADLLKALQHRADRLGCSRAALARDLVARGLSDLEAAAAIDGEAE